MSDVSYVRAAISCLPVAGPFVSLYNDYELGAELNALPEAWELSQSDADQAHLRSALTVLSEGFSGDVITTAEKLNAIEGEQRRARAKKRADRDKRILSCKKGHTYSACGMVGNLLTVALAVGLVALGIFTGLQATATITLGCVSFAQFVRDTVNLGDYRADLARLQNP